MKLTISELLLLGLLFTLLIYISCGGERIRISNDGWGLQKLSKAVSLKSGYDPDAVITLLGEPDIKEIRSYNNSQSYIYCGNSKVSYEYVEIVFGDKGLEDLSYYSISIIDVAKGYSADPSKDLIHLISMESCRVYYSKIIRPENRS